MRITTSDNVELNVRISGQGKPCLFLHGGPGAWSYNFEVLGGNALEKDLQMIYLDQRGCGRSGKVLNGDFSMNRIVQDMEEVRKALNIEKWVVMAHSFGGILAVNYARKHADSIEAMILSNCTLDMRESMEHQVQYAMELLGLQENEEYANDRRPLFDRCNEIIGKVVEKDLFYKLQYDNYDSFLRVNEVDKELSNDGKFAEHVFSSEEYFEDYKKYTRDIDVPVLIISGREDHAVGPDHHKGFEFKRSQECVLEGRHVLYLENNKEFAECIRNFIA